MILKRAQKRLSIKKECLCLQTDPLRRVFSLVIFLILLTAFLLNVNFNKDFSKQRLPGSVLLIGIMAVVLYQTFYCWKLYYKQGDNIIHIQKYLLFVKISDKKIYVSETKEIREEHTVLLRKNKSPKKRSNPPVLFGKKNYELVYLYLICNKKILLDSSINAGQIRMTGMGIAEYMNIKYMDVDVERKF